MNFASRSVLLTSTIAPSRASNCAAASSSLACSLPAAVLSLSSAASIMPFKVTALKSCCCAPSKAKILPSIFNLILICAEVGLCLSPNTSIPSVILSPLLSCITSPEGYFTKKTPLMPWTVPIYIFIIQLYL